MHLLILTQKMDKIDPILGFFYDWVLEFSKKFESISVICLQKGEYKLPENVQVFSLGKESGGGKLKYIFNFYKYIWQQRKNYNAVLVHMNQEYVLLGGLFWKLMGKKIYMWRNHHQGSFLTDIAAAFCQKVFCTSKYSYTAKYQKTVLMPVGIDLNKFAKPENLKTQRQKNSILFLGRISPTKNVHIFIEALDLLKKKGIDFKASIYGDALPKDGSYYESLLSQVENLGLQNNVKFYKGVPNDETPRIYNSNEIYVNLSSDGMYDKTIFEAFACGCLVLVSNLNLKGLIDHMLLIEKRQAGEISERINQVINLSVEEKEKLITEGMILARENSLDALSQRIKQIIS